MKTIVTRIMILFWSSTFVVGTLYAQQESAKPIYKIETKREGVPLGNFTIELFPYVAPKAVAYFDSLVTIKFFDSTAFHRVVPAFVIQGGDPNSKHLPRNTWGNGDPAQKNVPAEFNNIAYFRGVLGAARDNDPNSANSQFFICVANAFSLNAQYTAYGKVISGMDIVDSIVRSPRDASDNPLKKIEMFVTKIGLNDSVPTIPVQIKPLNNANRMTTDSLLIWSAVSGAVLYRLEIASDSLFTQIVFTDDIATSSYILKSIQLGLKKYYWRVYANNGGHRSGFSSIRSFITSVAIPVLQFPANGAVEQPTNVFLRWNTVFGATAYHVQVATNALFTDAGLVFDQTGIVDTAKQMLGFALSKKYYWRVAALTSEYEGTFALQSYFYTGTSLSVDRRDNQMPESFGLEQNYPNPFNPSTVISYQLSVTSHVLLKVYDALGKEIVTLVNKQQDAGRYSVELNGEKFTSSISSKGGYASGIYFYTLTAGKFFETKKMTLQK